MSRITSVIVLARRNKVFFDNISAAKDDFQFFIWIYFDALDHLADDGIIILESFLFSLRDNLPDLIETVIGGAVRIVKLLNSIQTI